MKCDGVVVHDGRGNDVEAMSTRAGKRAWCLRVQVLRAHKLTVPLSTYIRIYCDMKYLGCAKTKPSCHESILSAQVNSIYRLRRDP